MKKFGFSSKKDKDGGDRSKNSSPAPSANPYAVQAQADPYANPPAYSGGPPSNDRFGADKSPGNASAYGSDRYGSGAPGGYGQSGGYSGASRYGAPPSDAPTQSAYGECGS
jgi:hypothetical protein